MPRARKLTAHSLSLSIAFAFSVVFVGSLVGARRADAAAPVIVKLGTLAPKGSTWETLLKQLGQEWSKLSNGQVTLRIYAGGTLGSEGDMVKKIRVGQLQAAALTTVGLHDISADPQSIDVPMMIDSTQELKYVRDRMSAELEKDMEGKGFVVLAWSEVGFVRFFSTKRYDSIQALQQGAKVFCWEGDPASADAWRAAGFKPVVMSSTDVVPSLQTGLIDTVAMTPLYAFTTQTFRHARYMIDTPWASLTGAMIVHKDVWDRIPEDIRPKLLQAAQDIGQKIDAEVRRMDGQALTSMQREGLVVVKGDPAALMVAAKAAWKVIRGRVVPTATFDEVQRLAAESKSH